MPRAQSLSFNAQIQRLTEPDVDGSTVAPAAEAIPGAHGVAAHQLTDGVIANLTSLELSDIALFNFAHDTTASNNSCKTYPGDEAYPSRKTWNVLDVLTGGALIRTVPIGAVCYENEPEHYDAERCQVVLDGWSDDIVHEADPTSAMSPVYQGATCLPQNGNVTGSTCTLGGYPDWSVNATTVAQIQLAINFARATGVRLVVQNTGHDYLGKSLGSGALSIWTHNIKEIDFIEAYRENGQQQSDGGYTGPAVRVGAGVNLEELYAFADAHNFTAVGGECKGVGVAGGYFAGGGHSPLSGLHGMGSDHVLAVDIVLPDGRFVTATAHENADLFWALRGGGSATWGVVTAVTFRVHPRMSFSGVTWAVDAGPDVDVSVDLLFEALYAYWRRFPDFADRGSYGYSKVISRGTAANGTSLGYTWTMLPWLVPGMPLADFKAMLEDLLDEWAAMGFLAGPDARRAAQFTWFEHDNFHDTWKSHFPVQRIGRPTIHTASRLFPRANWQDPALLNRTLDAIRSTIVDGGSMLVHYNMNPSLPASGERQKDSADSALLPAWRDTVFFGIFGISWETDDPPAEIAARNLNFTKETMGRLRDITPNDDSGSYLNEGDVMEPDFSRAFWGTNYPRLREIKTRLDPWDTFWAPTAVGSEGWYIAGIPDWLTIQTGKLCRRGSQE